MKSRLWIIFIYAWVLNRLAAQESSPVGALFNQPLAASQALRIEQAQELDRYILQLRENEGEWSRRFTPNYTSAEAYVRSMEGYRTAFSRAIAYPPPGDVPKTEPLLETLGEDELATYYRVTLAVLPGVHAQGLYLVPKGISGARPLIIALHGGGGSPELATFNGGSNYRDMVRGGIKRGYVVFAPQHLTSAEGLPKEIRRMTDERLRLVGTTITAVEIAKITRSLDVLLRRPEIDARRIAMIGLSYGGYFTQVTTALERRIRVAITSCYFWVQEGRYARDELSVPTDFRFFGRFTVFRDPDLAALICPRPFQIQAGSGDGIDHREPGRMLAPIVAEHYQKLGLSGRFEHTVFEGKHEFHDAIAWSFLEKNL